MKRRACRRVVLSALVAGALLGANAAAQTIYRCGNEYTRVPCRDGRALDTADPRSAAQHAEARQRADEERRAAAAMTKDRLAGEAALRPALASSLSGPRAATPAASAPKSHAQKKKKPPKASTLRDDAPFVARVPNEGSKAASRR